MMKAILRLALGLFIVSGLACGQGIEVGNPSLKLLQGFVDVTAENSSSPYRLIFTRGQRVTVEKAEDLDFSQYQAQASEASFLANLGASDIEWTLSFSEASTLSAVALKVDGAERNNSYQSYLGQASPQVAGSYAWFGGSCAKTEAPLDITQAGAQLTLQAGLGYNEGQSYTGSVDAEGFLDFAQDGKTVQALCQATLVNGYLSGSCELQGAAKPGCTLVYKKY